MTIAKTHTDYKLALPAQGSAAKPRVLEVAIPKMDINLSAAGVAGFAASADSLFPAGLMDGIHPLVQTRAVASGGYSYFQLRLKNTAASTGSFSIYMPGKGPLCVLKPVSGQPQVITLKPGEEHLFQLELSCGGVAAVGTKVPFKMIVIHSAHPGWSTSVQVNAEVAAPAKVTRKRPFLFYSDAEITDANKRAADPTQPWAKKSRDALIKSADAWLTLSVDVPTGEGAWSGYYVCKDGTYLTYDRAKPKAHLCKSEGKTYTGMPYDGCWRTKRFNELASAARTLGLAYRLTGKLSYAERAAKILMGFTRVYMSHRRHDNKYGSSSETATPSKSGGRLLSQTLDESGWLIKLLSAYDAVAGSGELSIFGRRVDIEHNLLRPAVAVIAGYDAGKSNWQAWHNAAIGAAGYCLEEQKWITAALSGASGFSYHMSNSMLADGFWYEGSIGYHLYTLSAYRWLALAARHLKVDLYAGGLLKMVRAPLLMALPDLSFPKLNDGGTGGLSSMLGALEAAAALTADKDAQAVLRLLYNTQKLDRSSEEALLLGANLGAGGAAYSFSPANFDATGYAVLRGGSGAGALYAGLDYGPHGAGHGHNDKLQLLLYGAGKLLLPDMGTTAYRLPYHAGFFKQTLSHNTVMLDELGQAGGDETPRKVKRFAHLSLSTGEASVGLVQAQVGKDVFGGSNLATRTVLLAHDHHALDLVNVYAPAAKKTDLLFHGQGALEISGGLNQGPAGSHAAGWASSKAGHTYLTPPTLSTGKAATALAGQLNTLGPVVFTWSNRLGISHDMDSVAGLSSGKVITTDKKQGTGAVLWEADNSGAAQFLNRTYTHDKLELSSYDTLEFWAKVSVAGLKWFGLKVYDLPNFDQATWQLNNKTAIPANTWVKFTINLNKPDGSWGGAKTAEQIVFRLQGSGSGPAKVTVLLDDLVVKKAGKAEVPLQQGLRLNTFRKTSADASNYIAADAPNNPPVTSHPLVILRGHGGSTNFLGLLTPFSMAQPTGKVSRAANGDAVRVVLPGGGEDALEVGAAGQGLYLHSATSKHVSDMGFIGRSTYSHPLVKVAGASTGDLVLAAADAWNLRYNARKLAPFELSWPTKVKTLSATVDGKSWAGKVYGVSASGVLYLVLQSLPDGEHVIKISPPSSSDGAMPTDQGLDGPGADHTAPDLPAALDTIQDTTAGSLDSGASGRTTPERGCHCRVGPGQYSDMIWFLLILLLLARRRGGPYSQNR